MGDAISMCIVLITCPELQTFHLDDNWWQARRQVLFLSQHASYKNMLPNNKYFQCPLVRVCYLDLNTGRKDIADIGSCVEALHRLHACATDLRESTGRFTHTTLAYGRPPGGRSPRLSFTVSFTELCV